MVNVEITCEPIQQLLKLTKSDVSIIAKDKIYLIAEADPKELTGNRVMITVDGDIKEQGKTIISRDVLNNIPKAGELTINNNILKCGTRSVSFKENFETLEPIELNEKLLTIPKKEFEKGIDVEYAMAKDDVRPVLKGIFLDQDNFVAIDGCRVAIRKHYMVSQRSTQGVLIPGDLVKLYKKVKSNEEIHLYICDEFITLQVGNIQMSVKLIPGEYIKYKNILPQDHKLEVITDCKEFLEVLTSYKNIEVVKLAFDSDVINIEAKNEVMSIEDKISCEMKGENVEIAFNIKYLIDSLKHYKGDVIFELTNSVSPMIITDDENKTDLILPVRIVNSTN